MDDLCEPEYDPRNDEVFDDSENNSQDYNMLNDQEDANYTLTHNSINNNTYTGQGSFGQPVQQK